MKKVIVFSTISLLTLTSCGVDDSTTLLTQPEENNKVLSNSVNSISKMDIKLAKEITNLFDLNKDGKISSNEFSMKVSFHNSKDQTFVDYRNWDSIKNQSLSPITLETITKALVYNDGVGYVSFYTPKPAVIFSENLMESFSLDLAELLSKDSNNVKGKIPVSTMKYSIAGTNNITEVLSVNSLKKALLRQFKDGRVSLLLSSNLAKNESKDTSNYRLSGLENKYIGFFY